MITRRDSAPAAVAAAAGGALTLVALVWVALGSQRGQGWDESAMNTVTGGRDTQLTVLSLLGYVSIGAIVAVVIGCVVVALLRGRLALAAAAVVVVAGSNVTTQVLKHTILQRPDLGLGTLNSLPSGHTTVVASSVGAALLVSPLVARPFLADPAFRAEVLERRLPTGRLATLDDVAHAARYLACDASSSVTGHMLRVDGGWTAW